MPYLEDPTTYSVAVACYIHEMCNCQQLNAMHRYVFFFSVTFLSFMTYNCVRMTVSPLQIKITKDFKQCLNKTQNKIQLLFVHEDRAAHINDNDSVHSTEYYFNSFLNITFDITLTFVMLRPYLRQCLSKIMKCVA